LGGGWQFHYYAGVGMQTEGNAVHSWQAEHQLLTWLVSAQMH
jgi:hypothetical protein